MYSLYTTNSQLVSTCLLECESWRDRPTTHSAAALRIPRALAIHPACDDAAIDIGTVRNWQQPIDLRDAQLRPAAVSASNKLIAAPIFAVIFKSASADPVWIASGIPR